MPPMIKDKQAVRINRTVQKESSAIEVTNPKLAMISKVQKSFSRRTYVVGALLAAEDEETPLGHRHEGAHREVPTTRPLQSCKNRGRVGR